MDLRPRQGEDVEQLEVLSAAVRALDHGYPPRLPRIFASLEALAAWVAIDEGAIVGHIELQPESAAPVMARAVDATQWPPMRLVVVARLLVAPAARRRGIGTMLLGRAVDEAHGRGRWPVLDVGPELDSALALYESRGWTRVGSVSFSFRDGPTTRETQSFVYVGPPPSSIVDANGRS